MEINDYEKQIKNLKEELRAMTADRDYWLSMHQFASEESYKEGIKTEKQIERLQTQVTELKAENLELKHKLNTVEFFKQLDKEMSKM